MCQNCFENEISHFSTDNDYLKIDLELSKKLSSGKMKFLSTYRDEYKSANLYQCAFCGQKWKLQEPDNSIRGFLTKAESVFYNNIEISNWTDYITVKFANDIFFEIQKSEIKTDWIVTYNWTVKSKTNKTSICFIGLSGDKILDYCVYANDECEGVGIVGVQKWADLTGDQTAMFTQRNIDILDKELDYPIYSGWFSIDYYLFGNYIRAETYSSKGTKNVLGVDVNNRYTCLELILFPIFMPIRLLTKVGIIGEKRESFIEPIKKINSK